MYTLGTCYSVEEEKRTSHGYRTVEQSILALKTKVTLMTEADPCRYDTILYTPRGKRSDGVHATRNTVILSGKNHRPVKLLSFFRMFFTRYSGFRL